MTPLKRETQKPRGREGRRLGERATLEVRFSWAMDLLWLAFQPIVGWRERCVFGYEALLRSSEPLMMNPAEILEAAAKLGRIQQLGRAVRAAVAAAAPRAPAGTKLLVKLRSADLHDEDLYSAAAPLTTIAPRVVLEVTERESVYGVKDVAACVAKLKALGFRIAVDDLVAGTAGLTSLTQLEPDIAKLDRALVRDVDSNLRHRSAVSSTKRLCDNLGVSVIAEGVETPGERDALARLGCDLLQGHLFARPRRGFEDPRW